MQVIIYPKDGHVAVIAAAPGRSLASLIDKMVPKGVDYRIVEDSDLPSHGVFFDAFTYTDPVSIDMGKAKKIVHSRRREVREKQFEPLDALIAKQIPGISFEEIDSKREKIRHEHASIQNEIDGCSTPDQLVRVLQSINALL